MPSPVPILQHDSEIEWMMSIYRQLQPRSVLELGVWHGGTLYRWLAEARNDVPVTVVAVDTVIVDPGLFASWKPKNVTLHLIEGASGDPATLAQVQEISDWFDWIFIDADHHYAAVQRDWELYGLLGDAIVFHDVTSAVNHDQQVPLFWRDLKHEGWSTSEYTEPGNDWGGIGIVHRISPFPTGIVR